MKERSIPCIALNRSNNSGGFYFMSLESGKRHNSNQWEELPITDDIIMRVDNLTKQQAVTEIILKQLNMDLKFSMKNVDWNDNIVDSDYVNNDEESQEDNNNSVADAEENLLDNGNNDIDIGEINDNVNIIPDDSNSYE